MFSAEGNRGRATLQGTEESLRIKQQEEQVSALRSSVICTFNQLAGLKGPNTGVHSTRLAEWVCVSGKNSVSRKNNSST